jgi:hypothetical protein
MTKKEYVNFLVENTKLILIEKSSIDEENLLENNTYTAIDCELEEELEKLFEDQDENENYKINKQDFSSEKRRKDGKTYKENTSPELGYDVIYYDNLDQIDSDQINSSRPQMHDEDSEVYKENTSPEAYETDYDGNLPDSDRPDSALNEYAIDLNDMAFRRQFSSICLQKKINLSIQHPL